MGLLPPGVALWAGPGNAEQEAQRNITTGSPFPFAGRFAAYSHVGIEFFAVHRMGLPGDTGIRIAHLFPRMANYGERAGGLSCAVCLCHHDHRLRIGIHIRGNRVRIRRFVVECRYPYSPVKLGRMTKRTAVQKG